ncbi:MAG: PAS domain S-box protein, partial [Acidimicrobiales bacterium]
MKSLSANATENHASDALHADALLDGLDLVAMVVDATGRVTFCNNALLRLLGCSSCEVVGRNWFESFLDDAARPGVVELFQDVLHERDVDLRHQNEIVCKDGT